MTDQLPRNVPPLPATTRALNGTGQIQPKAAKSCPWHSTVGPCSCDFELEDASCYLNDVHTQTSADTFLGTGTGSPLRAGTWPNCGVSALANGTEIETGGDSKSKCPALKFKLTPEGRVQVLPPRRQTTAKSAVQLKYVPYVSRKRQLWSDTYWLMLLN